MSIKILLKKPAGKTDSFSFGATMELEADVVKELKLVPGFRRLTAALLKTLKRDKQAIGISFIRIDFGVIYDTTEKGL